ncbi:conjugal transfer protein TraG [Actinomycetota bacterium]|nr:conjugal transfer protein TraG [Actinomycetota bacterium]
MRVEDVSLPLGRSRAVGLHIPLERAVYVLGPARGGKGTLIVVPFILAAPGAVVTTSTRTDNLRLTAGCRARRGPVEAFNLDAVGGLPHTIDWDPLEGCADPAVAQRRARTLVSATGMSGENAPWATTSGGIVQALLHAAALDSRTIADVYTWSRSPAKADEAMRILETRGRGDAWHLTIAQVRTEDPRMRANKWFGVDNAFAGLAVKAVRDRLVPRPGAVFDTAAFLAASGTCYMVARGADVTEGSTTAGTVGGFYSLFLDHVTDTARRLSQAAPGGRLDPPLTIVADELANIDPWSAAPRMSAAGGGEGIQLVKVFQSRSQAAAAYGDKAEETMWDNSTNVILGGGKSEDYLGALSRTLGEVEHKRVRTSFSGRDPFTADTSVDGEWRPAVSVDELRRLPAGTALVVQDRIRPVLTDLVPYWQGPHAACVAASEEWHAAHPGQILTSRPDPVCAP